MDRILLKDLPPYHFVQENDQDVFLYSMNFKQQFNENKMKLLVDKLYINGAECVFYGDKSVRTQGIIL